MSANLSETEATHGSANYQAEGFVAARPARNITITIIGLLLFITVVLGLFLNKMFTPRVLSETELQINGAFVFPQARILDEFNLTTQDQSPFGLVDLQGKWSLIFFGFTSCPDVCPTTLATIRQMMQTLDKNIAENTQVVFVTVDPAKDTPEAIKDYLAAFDKKFIGLTGEFLAVKRFANQLNVPFQKVKTGPDSYTVDHGSNILIVNPYGHFHGFLKFPLDVGRGKLTFQSMVTSF